MAEKLLCLFFLPPALSFFLRVHSPLHHPLHHHHHNPHHHQGYHHDHDVHDYRAIVRHHGHFYHRPVHHHHVLPPLHRHHLHSYDQHKYHQKYQEPVYHQSYEVPKYSSYSSDDQSYHHDLHHRADDGEDVGVELEGVGQLCQHLEGATRALCYLCGEEDENSGCWEDPCWLAREEEQEECRLQLERELLNLEKKNLESGDEEESLGEQSVIGDDDSNEDLGATNGHPSFEGTGSESLQEIDLGSLKVTELGMVHRGLGAAQESQVGGKPEPSVLAKISDIKTSFNARGEGVQDEEIDPSVLQLITVPITDPV